MSARGRLVKRSAVDIIKIKDKRKVKPKDKSVEMVRPALRVEMTILGTHPI